MILIGCYIISDFPPPTETMFQIFKWPPWSKCQIRRQHFNAQLAVTPCCVTKFFVQREIVINHSISLLLFRNSENHHQGIVPSMPENHQGTVPSMPLEMTKRKIKTRVRVKRERECCTRTRNWTILRRYRENSACSTGLILLFLPDENGQQHWFIIHVHYVVYVFIMIMCFFMIMIMIYDYDYLF